MTFGAPGVRELRWVFLGRIAGLGARLPLVFRLSLAEVSCVFVAVGLGARPLVGLVPVGSIGSVKVCAQFFTNSSLAPVLLFRRRLKSVADALNRIKQHGITPGRWDALFRYWDAVSFARVLQVGV